MTKKLMDDLNSIESLIRSEDHFKLAESSSSLMSKEAPFLAANPNASYSDIHSRTFNDHAAKLLR